MSEHPAGWYPDPIRRHQHRYWDGRSWTEHVGSNGATSTDPMPPQPPATAHAAQGDPARSAVVEDDRLQEAQIQGILAEAGVQPVGAGGGTLFDEPVLIVYQWVTDLAEGFRYSILSPAGTVVGRCHEMLVDKLDPAEASFGELMNDANTDRIALVDPSGAPWARLAHKKVWKSKVTMTDAAGREIGVLQQENVLGKVRLGLEAGGQDLGEIISDNTQLLGFTITDVTKNPIGRVIKLGRYAQPGVLGPRKVVGCYVLRLESRPAQPMHSLVVAAPLAIDLAFSVTQAGQRSLGRTITGH
ncbi:MAG: DUF2510 domain-containing protein [Streptosporangiales bacterium]|nr:DUF2510 domain-containing protein [Streptosporangiales bacterium]